METIFFLVGTKQFLYSPTARQTPASFLGDPRFKLWHQLFWFDISMVSLELGNSFFRPCKFVTRSSYYNLTLCNLGYCYRLWITGTKFTLRLIYAIFWKFLRCHLGYTDIRNCGPRCAFFSILSPFRFDSNNRSGSLSSTLYFFWIRLSVTPPEK